MSDIHYIEIMEKAIYNTELVEKLREVAKARMKPMPLSVFIPMCQEAADRIEAQERYIEKLVATLEQIKSYAITTNENETISDLTRQLYNIEDACFYALKE